MVKRIEYFTLHWKNTNKAISSAFISDDIAWSYDLIPELEGKNELPFDLNMVQLKVGKKGLIKSDDLSEVKDIWVDYQANRMAYPLMSERLKNIIENNINGNEYLDWISCNVIHKEEKRIYYIPRFNKLLDVLDFEKTMFVPNTDTIIKHVLCYEKIKTYSIFTAYTESYGDLYKITPRIYFNETIAKLIKKEKLTGLVIDKVKVP